MPLWGQPGNGRYSQVRSALARAAGRGQLVPSITHSGRPSITAESTSVRVNRARTSVTSTEPSASAVARARPQPPKCGSQAESHQRAAVGCRQCCIQQFEQTILTKAQAVVELLPEANKRRQFFGFQHTPRLARFSPNRKTLRLPGPVCCPNSSYNTSSDLQ